jgi:hypothetical protein
MNPEGFVVLMPDEIKAPTALKKVGSQFEDFADRLGGGNGLVAVFEDGTELTIPPERMLFDAEFDLDKTGATFLASRRLQRTVLTIPSNELWKRLEAKQTQPKPGATPSLPQYPYKPGDEFRVPTTSLGPNMKKSQTGFYFWTETLLIRRDWPVQIVKAIID